MEEEQQQAEPEGGSSLQHLNISQGLSTTPLSAFSCETLGHTQHAQHCTGVSQLPWPCRLPFPAQRAHGLPAGWVVGKSVSSSARYDTTVGSCNGSSEAVGKYEGQGRLRFV